MLFDEAFPCRYLKATDLKPRQSVTVMIDRTTMEEVGKEKDRRLVLYFRDKKVAIVCNKTNACTIADAYGKNLDNWIGKQIRVFRATTSYAGETMPCLRVAVGGSNPGAANDTDGGGREPEPPTNLVDDIPF